MIIEAPKERPPVITLLGEPGMGKTLLACMFPDAIIIRLEDGIQSVPVEKRPAIMPIVTTVDMLEEQIRWVVMNRKAHGKKTLIIDSITRAETMFEKHIVETDGNNPASINQACGGFGAGPKALGALHAKFRGLLKAANDRGFTVIIIAHASTETVEPPDGENYSRYTMRLGKHSIAPWSDDVDMIGFLCLQKFVRGAKDETKMGKAKAGKALSDGTRLLVVHAVAGNISKNRFGIEEPIELPPVAAWDNPLLKLIPYYSGNIGPLVSVQEQAKPEPEVKTATKPQSEDQGFDATEAQDDDDSPDAPTAEEVAYQEPEL